MHSTCTLVYSSDSIINYSCLQERPVKPDIPWLTQQLWNTCCDMEELTCFKGILNDIVCTPVGCKIGTVEVRTIDIKYYTISMHYNFLLYIMAFKLAPSSDQC